MLENQTYELGDSMFSIRWFFIVASFALFGTPAMADPGAPKGTTPMVVSISLSGPAVQMPPVFVSYTVLFSEAVMGVSEDDFALTVTGDVSAQIVGAFQNDGIGQEYLVEVDVASGLGTLRLDLLGATDIQSTGNGSTPPAFTGGDVLRLAFESPAIFSFNQSLKDSRGNLEFTETGTGSSFGVETVMGSERTVRTYNEGNGLRLPVGNAVVVSDTYTLHMRIRLDDVTSRRKLIDFSDGASDNGLYLEDGRLVFLNGSTNGATVIANDEWADVAMTRDASGNVTGYVNGVEQWTFTDAGNEAQLDAGPLVFFADDDTTGDEHPSGGIVCTQMIDGALAAPDVGALDCPFRVGLNSDGCSFDTIDQALAVAGDTDRIHLTEQDEYIGRLSIDNRTVYLEGSLLDQNCVVGVFGAIDVPTLRNPNPVTGRGGVVEVVGGATATFVNVRIDGGTAGQGGSIYAGPGSSLTLFSATVENGIASSEFTGGTGDPAGGCLFADGASVSLGFAGVDNCSVLDGLGQAGGNGGGIAIVNDSDATLQFGGIENSLAIDGGGLYALNSRVVIQDNAGLTDNVAEGSGGGMALIDSSLSFLQGPNTLGVTQAEPLSFIRGNTATGDGGGIYIADTLNNALNVGRMAIEDNSARNGGGMAIEGSAVRISDTQFHRNSAIGAGGGVYVSGGFVSLGASEDCRPYLYSNLFFPGDTRYCSRLSENTAAFGSAMSIQAGADVNIARTALLDNGTADSVIEAAGSSLLELSNAWLARNATRGILGVDSATVEMYHTTIARNAGEAILLRDSASAGFYGSILSGNSDGVVNIGSGTTDAIVLSCNLDQSATVGSDQNPLLGTTTRGEDHLLTGSPAIDLCGANIELPSTVDLDGVPRIQEMADDAGAFESGPFIFGDGLE